MPVLRWLEAFVAICCAKFINSYSEMSRDYRGPYMYKTHILESEL